ncbi:LLM class flavin-dependent oxidoreductase [Amycolatopsis alba]|uniref:LLM class flavin-dependent oxidoreductase n=1 Tax=Amycolatopsis alba DSM 44262 TaxID=1125972 RepID=A0A229RMZ8_AMYAL|nr:LLM class flavin-dependent oxidoreductase [Amycolatopsis alba]OXM47955.1 LLM class flavin-dependent oxidoreductase [Amycolatopsis alba DSM 44262]
MHVGFEAAFQHRGSYPDADFMRKELHACVQAETLGFDSIWLTEHHFSNYGLIADPLQALSYLAARTSRVRLGTAVLVLPWHDPVRLAEQIILADHLSGGRLVLGLGRGLAKDEFEGFRVPLDESRARFAECAELVLPALETGFIEGGETTRQPRRELRPRPLKSFQGRVFSASVSPESSPLVAKMGLGMMLIIFKPLHLMEQDVQRYRGTWSDLHGMASEPPGPLLSVVVVVDKSTDRALEIAKKHNDRSHDVAVAHYGMADKDFGRTEGYEFYQSMRPVARTDLDLTPSTVVHGTPDQVLEQLETLHRTFDLQGLLTIFHGIPDQDGHDSLHTFAEYCLPELKSWPAESTF